MLESKFSILSNIIIYVVFLILSCFKEKFTIIAVGIIIINGFIWLIMEIAVMPQSEIYRRISVVELVIFYLVRHSYLELLFSQLKTIISNFD